MYSSLENCFMPFSYHKARSLCCLVLISVSPLLRLTRFLNEPYNLYGFLVFSDYVFPFPTLPATCFYAFVTSARVFLERAKHACIDCLFHPLHLLLPWFCFVLFYFLPFISVPYFNNGMFIYVCYFGWRV